MKEFLALEKALNRGFILTPDKGTSNEGGSYVATNSEQLGSIVNDEWRGFDEEKKLYLSTINPAQMVRREVEVPINGEAIISIYSDPAEGIDGVRVQALGEDFVIGLHDLKDEDGEVIHDQSYDTIMKRLKEINSDTFNRKQATLVGLYLDEINDKLVEAGGEAFKRNWYITNELRIPREKSSCADYYSDDSWFFSGADGCVGTYYRCYGAFRCRPSLALALRS